MESGRELLLMRILGCLQSHWNYCPIWNCGVSFTQPFHDLRLNFPRSDTCDLTKLAGGRLLATGEVAHGPKLSRGC